MFGDLQVPKKCWCLDVSLGGCILRRKTTWEKRYDHGSQSRLQIECKTKRKSVSVYSIFYNHFIEFPHSFLWNVLKVDSWYLEFSPLPEPKWHRHEVHTRWHAFWALVRGSKKITSRGQFRGGFCHYFSGCWVFQMIFWCACSGEKELGSIHNPKWVSMPGPMLSNLKKSLNGATILKGYYFFCHKFA